MKSYGWVPDLPDHRDHHLALARVPALPPVMDLRPFCPSVYDQGTLGSCTANAIAAAIQFERAKQLLAPDFVPSRLFIYYNERVIEHTVASDAGASLRDGMKSVAKKGDCPEDQWPYIVARFADLPPDTCYAEALKHRALSYARVPRTLHSMRACLAAGFPFVFGFSVYESFETAAVAASGIAPMPALDEAMLGGHAVLAVGYDHAERRFIARNSWGSGWGAAGYFTLPYEYLLDRGLAGDFWSIRVES